MLITSTRLRKAAVDPQKYFRMSSSFAGMARSINVFGKPLQAASGPGEPTTGFFRDGYWYAGILESSDRLY